MVEQTPQYDENGYAIPRKTLLAWKAVGLIGVTDERGDFEWPFCIIDGCTNRACMRLNSPRCWPHTLPGVPVHVEAEETLPETVSPKP